MNEKNNAIGSSKFTMITENDLVKDNHKEMDYGALYMGNDLGNSVSYCTASIFKMA